MLAIPPTVVPTCPPLSFFFSSRQRPHCFPLSYSPVQPSNSLRCSPVTRVIRGCHTSDNWCAVLEMSRRPRARCSKPEFCASNALAAAPSSPLNAINAMLAMFYAAPCFYRLARRNKSNLGEKKIQSRHNKSHLGASDGKVSLRPEFSCRAKSASTARLNSAPCKRRGSFRSFGTG